MVKTIQMFYIVAYGYKYETGVRNLCFHCVE